MNSKAWEKLRDALAGDTKSARQVLAALASAIRETPDDWWRDVVAEMLERVADGEDANVSLMVDERPNRRKNTHAKKARICLAVNALIGTGTKREEAFKIVADKESEAARSDPMRGRLDKPVLGPRGVQQIFSAMEKESKALGLPTAHRESVSFSPKELSALKEELAAASMRTAERRPHITALADSRKKPRKGSLREY